MNGSHKLKFLDDHEIYFVHRNFRVKDRDDYWSSIQTSIPEGLRVSDTDTHSDIPTGRTSHDQEGRRRRTFKHRSL